MVPYVLGVCARTIGRPVLIELSRITQPQDWNRAAGSLDRAAPFQGYVRYKTIAVYYKPRQARYPKHYGAGMTRYNMAQNVYALGLQLTTTADRRLRTDACALPYKVRRHAAIAQPPVSVAQTW